MNPTNASTLSIWTLWAPLKFALTTFFSTSIIGLLYSFIAVRIYTPTPVPYQPLLWLTTITFIICAIRLFYKLPHITPDRESFIATHNLQTALTATAFIAISLFITQNANKILLQLATLGSSSASILFIFSMSSILLLYLIGILLSNFFLKFRRIQTLNIPTWKIICCMPFGFSALWAPGYILPDLRGPTNSITIKPNWYKNITHLITSNPATTISVFALLTMLSGFVYGINAVLLTFILSLIFGIWTISVGIKKFIKTMPGKYATVAVIINIAIIIALTLGTHIYTHLNQTTTINIIETTETINL